MWPYFAIYFLIIFLSIPSFRLSILVLTSILIFCLLALKGIVGCDYIGYYYHYIYFNPNETFVKLRGEIGWWYIEYFIYNSGLGYQWYYFISGAIGAFFLFLTQKEIKSTGLLIIIYPIIIIQLGLSGIRQFAAVCLVMFIISKYIFNPPRSIIPFVVTILIAATFHISSIAMFLFLPLLKKLSGIILAVLIISGLLGILSSFSEAVYSTYETAYLYEGARGSNGAWIRFILTALILAIGAYSADAYYLRIAITIILFGLLVGTINSIALHRMNYYLYPLAGLLLIKYFKDDYDNRHILRLCYLLSVVYMFFWFNFSTHSHCLIPYKFFFQESQEFILLSSY